MLCIHYTFLENRLHACSQQGLIHTPPLPSAASDSTYSSALLMGGAKSAFDAVSRAVQEISDKSTRQTHSAGTPHFCNALNHPKPAGNYGNTTWKIQCI